MLFRRWSHLDDGEEVHLPEGHVSEVHVVGLVLGRHEHERDPVHELHPVQVLDAHMADVITRVIAAVGARAHAVHDDFGIRTRHLPEMLTQRVVVGAQVLQHGEALMPDADTHVDVFRLVFVE